MGWPIVEMFPHPVVSFSTCLDVHISILRTITNDIFYIKLPINRPTPMGGSYAIAEYVQVSLLCG